MGGLELLSPWMLAGLGALAVPVLVHLALREESRGRAFPSLMFVRRVPYRARRRRRLRDPWLLLLRCLAVAAIVLAFAGPRCAPETAEPSLPAHDVVFLLDRSYSMTPASRWQRARAEIDDRLDRLGPDGRAALVVFDQAPQVWSELGGDRGELRRRLDALTPGELATDLARAVAAAEEVLREGGARERELVVISDFQRSSLAASATLELDPATRLELVPVSGPIGVNVAVVDARLAGPGDGAAADAGVSELVVTLRNTGDAAAPQVDVVLDVGGRSETVPPMSIAPGEQRTVRAPVVLVPGRPTPTVVRVGPDAIEADNVYELVITAPPPVEVVMVADPASAAGLFVREALSAAGEPAVRLQERSAEALDTRSVAGADVLIWAAERAPGPAPSEVLGAFLERGAGVLLFLEEPAPGGDRSAPRWLGEVRRGSPPADGARPEPRVGDRRVAAPSVLAPALEALADLRAFDYWRLTTREDDRVLARLENADPLVIERTHGAGRVLIAATGLSDRWSTIAVEPGFVPFLARAVGYLAGRTPAAPSHPAGAVIDLERVGRSQWPAGSWERFAATSGGVVKPPRGAVHRLAAGEVMFHSTVPGRYELHPSGGLAPLMFAVNVAREESVLAPYSPEELGDRIVRRAAAVIAPGVAVGRGEGAAMPGALAWYIVLLAALVFVGEAFGAAWLERRAGGAGQTV